MSIGVFDSGLGGLTAVKELKKLLPNEDIIYFGDTARLPYGSRGKETILDYIRSDINFMRSMNVNSIIIACGTASSIITSDIKEESKTPIFTVIYPTCVSAVKTSKTKRIGVIATSATIKSGKYESQIKNICPEAEVFSKECPLFVPLVENGYIEKNNQITTLVAQDYLSYFNDKNIDVLILGCTHYPVISELISNIMGSDISLIDSGKETAIYANKILQENNILDQNNTSGNISYYVSDSVDNFKNIASIFLGEEIKSNVKKINIHQY